MFVIFGLIVFLAIIGLSLYLSYGEEWFMTELLGYTKKGEVPVTNVILDGLIKF